MIRSLIIFLALLAVSYLMQLSRKLRDINDWYNKINIGFFFRNFFSFRS
jgi:predicted ferric reductase